MHTYLAILGAETFLPWFEACYFPQLQQFCYNYVRTCDTCQKFNYPSTLPRGFLQSIKTEVPLQIVSIDLMGPYPICVRHWSDI